MTVDLSTKHARSLWDKAVHSLVTSKDLVRKYGNLVEQGEATLRRDLGVGKFDLPTYFLEITEDQVIVTPKEQV